MGDKQYGKFAHSGVPRVPSQDPEESTNIYILNNGLMSC